IEPLNLFNELTSGEIVSLNFIESIKEARSRVQELTSGEIVSLNFIESIKEARSCVQDLTSGDIVSLNFIESIKEARSCVQDLTSGEIVSLNFIESIKEARSRVQDLTSGEIATGTARVGELNSLKERNAALEVDKGTLEGQLTAFESVAAAKDNKLVSLTAHDSLIDQVSSLEATCYGLCDQVLVYELFKEQYEVVHDEQVKVLNDKVLGLDAELMGMALHLDEEFYPCFLTTIAGQSRAIDKGMKDGLVADFPLLAQLESQKDASIADIIGLLHLEGPTAETPEANHRLSFSDVMVTLIEPLCAENLVGEASTSGVPAAVAATTALSTTFVQASSVLPIPASNYKVVDTEPQVEVSSSPKIIFEQETLETLPKHPAT
ncbi:hypothetical protein Tco_0805345, partial [Tanacetum coccineum]